MEASICLGTNKRRNEDRKLRNDECSPPAGSCVMSATLTSALLGRVRQCPAACNASAPCHPHLLSLYCLRRRAAFVPAALTPPQTRDSSYFLDEQSKSSLRGSEKSGVFVWMCLYHNFTQVIRRQISVNFFIGPHLSF